MERRIFHKHGRFGCPVYRAGLIVPGLRLVIGAFALILAGCTQSYDPSPDTDPVIPGVGPAVSTELSLTIKWPDGEDTSILNLPQREIVLSRSGAGTLSGELAVSISGSTQVFCMVDGQVLADKDGKFLIRAADYYGDNHLISFVTIKNKIPHSRELPLTIVE